MVSQRQEAGRKGKKACQKGEERGKEGREGKKEGETDQGKIMERCMGRTGETQRKIIMDEI